MQLVRVTCIFTVHYNTDLHGTFTDVKRPDYHPSYLGLHAGYYIQGLSNKVLQTKKNYFLAK